MSLFKNYEMLAPIAVIDRDGTGMLPVRLRIAANCSTGKLWPERRIGVHFGQLLTGALTLEESAQLRALLEQAERDVLAGVTEDPPEVSDG